MFEWTNIGNLVAKYDLKFQCFGIGIREYRSRDSAKFNRLPVQKRTMRCPGKTPAGSPGKFRKLIDILMYGYFSRKYINGPVWSQRCGNTSIDSACHTRLCRSKTSRPGAASGIRSWPELWQPRLPVGLTRWSKGEGSPLGIARLSLWMAGDLVWWRIWQHKALLVAFSFSLDFSFLAGTKQYE